MCVLHDVGLSVLKLLQPVYEGRMNIAHLNDVLFANEKIEYKVTDMICINVSQKQHRLPCEYYINKTGYGYTIYECGN